MLIALKLEAEFRLIPAGMSSNLLAGGLLLWPQWAAMQDFLVSEQEIQRLQLQLAIAQTARNAYANALKVTCPSVRSAIPCVK